MCSTWRGTSTWKWWDFNSYVHTGEKWDQNNIIINNIFRFLSGLWHHKKLLGPWTKNCGRILTQKWLAKMERSHAHKVKLVNKTSI